MKITVIGEVNHGKTSLVESLLGKKLLKSRAEIKDLRTRDLQVEDIVLNDKVYYLLDCPGHNSYLNNSILPIPYSDLILILFSAVQGTVPEKILSLLQYCKYHELKILLVVTKVDLCTRDIFIKRITKIIALLATAGITNYQYCIFSTKRPSLRELVLNKIKKISQSDTLTNKNKNTLVLRSFSRNNPGDSVEDYKTGILGCLPSENLELGQYYLNQDSSTIPIKITKIINPSNNSTGYVTCDTNLSGCYSAFNRLKGAVVSKIPLERNCRVTLIVDKFIALNSKLKNKQCYIVIGFSIYHIEVTHINKNTYQATIPLLSESKFLMLEKNQKIWSLLAFGRITKK